MKHLLPIILLSTACGSKAPAPAAPAGGEATHEHAGGAGEHPPLPGQLEPMHAVIAPHWHMEGAARKDATCADLPQFEQVITGADRADAPGGMDVAAWQQGLDKLAADLAGVTAACGADLAAFDTAFGTFHDSFHALMDQVPEAAAAHDAAGSAS
jgi:hypothetical protein